MTIKTRRHGQKTFEQPPDPAPDLTEWTQHRFDPVYYLGGRIPGYHRYRRGRKNFYGYALIVGAVTTASIKSGPSESLPITIIRIALAFLQLVAGVKLLSGGSPSHPMKKS